MAANTPATYYLDTPALSTACAKEIKAIKKGCEPKDSTQKSMSEKLLGPKAAAKMEAMKKKIAKAGGAPRWIEDHCDGLWFKPVSPKQSPAISELAEDLKNFDSAKLGPEIRKQVTEIVRQLDDMIAGVAIEAAKNTAAKAGARTLAGSVFGPIGAALAQVINVVDTVVTAMEVGGKIIDLKDEIDGIKKVLEKLPDELKKIAGNAANNQQKAMADTMGLVSRLTACTRARRCQLVPMKETHDGSKTNCDGEPTEDTDISGPAQGKGCCPGQTGHHVLPGAMFKNCPSYKMMGAGGCPHQNAPTICVEGVNNAHGTHGAIHKQLATQMKRFPTGKISMDDAIDEGAESVKKTFPESGCTNKCLKAQLKNFYEKFKACEPLEANPGKSRNGGGEGGNEA